MRQFPILGTAILAALAAPAIASPRVIPQPSPEPLGVLVRDSQTIHVLRVEEVSQKRVMFKATATLKGKPDKAPFRFLVLSMNVRREGLFRAGDTVLCFCSDLWGNGDGDAVGKLHVRGRWLVAFGPIAWRGEKDWRCTMMMGDDRFGLTYVGSTEALREAVGAIVAGGEVTITARAPVAWNASGAGRLWRIRAGPRVGRFVLSDDSPHFVGWGTGDPDEVAKLVRALGEGPARERVTAAEDLAHGGAAARAVLLALRGALKDADASVKLGAACALVRLDPADKVGMEAIGGILGSVNPNVRVAAVRTLGDLGPLAGAALPRLVKALKDEHPAVRAAAAEAVGRVAELPPQGARTVAALTALLEDEQQDYNIRCAAHRALRCLGCQSWESLAAVRELLSTPAYAPSWPQTESIELLTRFDPPPVELLAQLMANRSVMRHDARELAAHNLGCLGRRARLALPVLRRVLRDKTEIRSPFALHSIRLDAARAILDIDAKGGPALATPTLLELVKEKSTGAPEALYLLARRGRVAKSSVPALLGRLAPDDAFTPYVVRDLTRLLGPEDRELLLKLRRLFANGDAGIELAMVLFRLGEKEKALAHAALRVEKKSPFEQVEAARWLGELGREAKSAEPALRRALDKATGAARARLALTLPKVRGAEGNAVRRRALGALDDLLSICERARPGFGPFEAHSFWRTESLGWGEEDAVGAAVATVLDRLPGKGDSVAPLARELRDSDPYVRLAAAAALARARPDHRDTVPALRKLLERHPHFFCFAADTLSALGATAASLAPVIEPLLRHPNDTVSHAAARVLRRIDPATLAKGWGAAGAPGAVPKDLESLWDDLADADALRADLAVWRLAGAGPRAVALLRKQLRAPTALPAERIARLIADLDSDDFMMRRRATAGLAEGIESAAPALRRALAAKPTPEARRRIKKLLDGLDWTREPEQRRRLRAVRLLAELGGADARALLEKLSRGDARFALTREAAAALRYLDR
jgi:hypothetical protein